MDELFSQVDELFQKGQYDYAIFLLTDAIASNDHKPESLYKRAVCHMQLNRYKSACDDLTEALRLNRTFPNAYIKQSKCYVALGDLTNAISAMKILEQLEPDNTYARFELRRLYELRQCDVHARKLFADGKFLEVVECMEKCLAKAEICVRFKLMKAECLIYLGKHQAVSGIVNEVLFTHKDDMEAICLRAMNLLYQEKYNLGLIELKEILPHSSRATAMYKTYKQITDKLSTAQLALSKNDYNAACHQYEQLLTLDPQNKQKNKTVHLQLAKALRAQHQQEDAMEHCTCALQIDENDLEALKIRAECNWDVEDYEMAVEDYKMAVSLEPNEMNRTKLKMAERKLDGCKWDKYSLLGVEENSSVADVKKAFRKLALQYHPDKLINKAPYAQHKIKIKYGNIQKAYQELLNIAQL